MTARVGPAARSLSCHLDASWQAAPSSRCAPLAVSSKTRSQPAFASASRCRSRCWSSAETRAYPISIRIPVWPVKIQYSQTLKNGYRYWMLLMRFRTLSGAQPVGVQQAIVYWTALFGAVVDPYSIGNGEQHGKVGTRPIAGKTQASAGTQKYAGCAGRRKRRCCKLQISASRRCAWPASLHSW